MATTYNSPAFLAALYTIVPTEGGKEARKGSLSTTGQEWQHRPLPTAGGKAEFSHRLGRVHLYERHSSLSGIKIATLSFETFSCFAVEFHARRKEEKWQRWFFSSSSSSWGWEGTFTAHLAPTHKSPLRLRLLPAKPSEACSKRRKFSFLLFAHTDQPTSLHAICRPPPRTTTNSPTACYT